MYLGKIVELADKDELFENPLHPYTATLLSSLPGSRNRKILRGIEESKVYYLRKK
jgi:peptide/nickel transport system ATP-binding protein